MEIYENSRGDSRQREIAKKGWYSKRDSTLIGLYIQRHNKQHRIVTAVAECEAQMKTPPLLEESGGKLVNVLKRSECSLGTIELKLLAILFSSPLLRSVFALVGLLLSLS